MVLYRVVFDNGKPFEKVFNSVAELEKGLRDFYEANKDAGNFDASVFNEKGEDITNSQFIDEIVGGIIGD